MLVFKARVNCVVVDAESSPYAGHFFCKSYINAVKCIRSMVAFTKVFPRWTLYVIDDTQSVIFAYRIITLLNAFVS